MIKHKISVLIIDSEAESLKYTKDLLVANPMVSDVESAIDSDEALLKIIKCNPDIILLEYPTKGKASEELIRFIQTKLKETTIVYVSKSKDYAANAIRNEVFNYLLKPITKVSLKKIISKVHLNLQNNSLLKINQIIENTLEETRLKFQTTKGYILIDPEEILYCMADGYCTKLYLTNNRVELSILFLSKLEEILTQFNFLRVSRWYLINQKYIRKIYRENNAIILYANGKEYEVKGSKSSIKNLSQIDKE